MTEAAAPPPLPADAWYYADGNHQQVGPVDQASLLELYRHGALRGESLVWRQGMEGWRSLQSVIALPPPDPLQLHSGVPSGVSTQKRKGMSGCMIVLLIALVLAVPVIGILAAIALPAYQQYVQRAKVAEMVAGTRWLRTEIETRRLSDPDAACPSDADLGAHASDSGMGIGRIEAGQHPSGYCGMKLTIEGTGQQALDGQHIVWEYMDTGDIPEWNCASSLPAKYLPGECR